MGNFLIWYGIISISAFLGFAYAGYRIRRLREADRAEIDWEAFEGDLQNDVRDINFEARS